MKLGGRLPAGKLASTAGLHGRRRRYACDPAMEPFQGLTDDDLAPLAAMLDETQRLSLVAFERSRGNREEDEATLVEVTGLFEASLAELDAVYDAFERIEAALRDPLF